MSDPSLPGRLVLQDEIRSRVPPTWFWDVMDRDTELAITKEHGQHLVGFGGIETTGSHGSVQEGPLHQPRMLPGRGVIRAVNRRARVSWVSEEQREKCIRQKEVLCQKLPQSCSHILIVPLLGYCVCPSVWKGINPSLNVKYYYFMDSVGGNLSWLMGEEDEYLIGREWVVQRRTSWRSNFSGITADFSPSAGAWHGVMSWII